MFKFTKCLIELMLKGIKLTIKHLKISITVRIRTSKQLHNISTVVKNKIYVGNYSNIIIVSQIIYR
jgi:hypothetical protein